MDSFEKHGFDDDAFGDKSGLTSGLRTFDAFPKTKPSYTSATERGGQWTLIIAIFCFGLTVSEFAGWWSGTETHHFSVERGIGHELQMNLDIVVKMACNDLHVNVQDAAMDRILAGHLLKKEDTNWDVWTKRSPVKDKGGYDNLHEGDLKRKRAEEEDAHVGHVIGHMREGGRKFVKTPNLKRSEPANSCRIYGSLEGNKVQGDFHITARGHGYMENEITHLDHDRFNFSHYVNELSFGPHYPNLLNPLDRTSDSTEINFYKFQYFLSIVPTIYTKRKVSTNAGILDPAAVPQPPTLDFIPDISSSQNTNGKGGNMAIPSHKPASKSDSKTVFTNQYAATGQSMEIPHSMAPGIFFKYDIEPILLIVNEQRGSFLGLIVRVVNVISGVIVGGGWLFQLSDWIVEVMGRRRRNVGGYGGGVLHG